MLLTDQSVLPNLRDVLGTFDATAPQRFLLLHLWRRRPARAAVAVARQTG